MKLLDTVVPAEDDGEGSNAKTIARDLARFGEPAKHELLNRAVGPHPGWQNVAGAILGEWKSWSPSDVPKLREALRKQPGGWVARPLGQIGTPEAIQALIEDLPKGSEGQTGFVLSHLGPRVIPLLFPLLENPEQAQAATSVIREIGKPALRFADEWVALASDVQKPLKIRLAALRGLAAIGPQAGPLSVKNDSLLTDADPAIRAEAKTTFRAVRNPAIVCDLARSCQPTASEFDPLAFESYMCLREIASYGEGAHDAAQLLVPFLNSKNAAERADATTVFGMAGYKPAVPQIEEELGAKDWRLVYATIRALGWLGDKAAASKIEAVSAAFWLPEVRELGAKTVAALRARRGTLYRPSAASMDLAEGPFEITQSILGQVAACPGHRWQWNDKAFILSENSGKNSHSTPLWGGTLTGTDHGEFMGELSWVKEPGKPVSILKDNVRALATTVDGEAIAMFGLAHMGFNYGYVLRVERTPGETFNLSEVTQLPAEGGGMVSLGPDLFAVETARRAVVFSSTRGILGLAKCR